ncbi:MAG: aminoacyl-tRNA hydrolase [Phycisphaerales bacterium]|nr:MAG: aminoacyl-tRNA hydrolase [Phycisphaerales bacterium]
MGDTRMVVGLGNPGNRYVDTRHNMGFMVIDSLSESLHVEVNKRKFGARFGVGELVDKKLILLKPWQFMNRSGQAVVTAAGFYRLDVGDMLVISDDMDLEPGRIRLRAKGSAGGHNGLADIAQKLGTSDFARCRIGIGRDDRQDSVCYVLDRPTKDQKPLLAAAIERARDAVFCWIENGIETAMNRFNRVSE